MAFLFSAGAAVLAPLSVPFQAILEGLEGPHASSQD